MGAHLGEFEQLLLFALLRLGEGASGADVIDEIERRAGREVSAGAVYTGFERLADKGFVTSEIGPPTGARGGKGRRLYRLEPPGAEALRAAYRTIDRMAEGVVGKLDVLGG